MRDSVISTAREMFWIGVVAAAIPIGMQLVALMIVSIYPSTVFPNADKAIGTIYFWIIQLVILFVALSTNIFVNYLALSKRKILDVPYLQLKMAVIFLMLVILSTFSFAATLGGDLSHGISIFEAIGLTVFIIPLFMLVWIVDCELALASAVDLVEVPVR